MMTLPSAPRSFLGSLALAMPVMAVVAACGSSGSNNGGGGSSSGSSSGASGSGSGGGSSSGGFSGSSGSDGGSSSGASSGGGPSTCLVGQQGCRCDSMGGCAPGLTCTSQAPPQASVCCSGSNCAPSGGDIGSSCSSSDAGAASCTPGITIPPASGTNDNCGYPAADFVESTTLCAINATGGGAQPAIIQVFYNDEHALTLGCATATASVSPLSTNPDDVQYPQTGDPACVDAMGRPLRPVLYVTDLTSDPGCTAGDRQNGGHPYDPIAVFGTWKSATEDSANVGTPAMMDPTANKWNLGPSADPLPTSDAGSTMSCNQNYSAELRFEVALISGHSYRFQVMVHDGDQNKGGDSGEACAIFCAGTGMSSCPSGVTACPGGNSAACPVGFVCSSTGCCEPNQ